MSNVDCKVVLLGSASAGKTCLLERYVHGRFNTKTQATIGGSFASKKEEVGSKIITLGCWDTAGSERYATMSRMYYRGAKAAIVCYDVTDRGSFDRARHWVSQLQEMEPECKIYLCGTKKDLADDNGRREVDAETVRPLANDLQADFFETSSKTGENVELVFKKIAKDFAIAENDLLGVSMDRSLGSSFKLSWKHDPRIAQSSPQSSCCLR